jgi:membrane protein YdbS with pleckstrin-like domain
MSIPTTTTKVMPRHLRATYLGDQEHLLAETRGTRWHYFPGPIAATIVFAALTYLGWGSRSGWALTHTWADWVGSFAQAVGGSADQFRTVFAWLFTVLLLISLLWFLVRYLRWISTVYAVTTHRVIVQKGILGRNFDQIPITQVRGVDVHQSFPQRLLRYGTLRVSSEGGGAAIGNEDWLGIPKPFNFQRKIENASEDRGTGTSPPPR